MMQSSLMSGGAFSVMQPGSSVATALSEGESKKKHVFVLEIREKKWRTIKIPLETVRPFTFDSVVLAGQPSVNPGNPDTVQKFLTKKVEEMIETANRERGANSPELPLIRLRVDYSGFSTINTQVFAHQFVNKVANPQDLVLWQKPPKRVERKTVSKKEVSVSVGEKSMDILIQENLSEALKLLPAIELNHALNEYVQKDEKMALVDTVKKVLMETQKEAEKETLVKNVDNVQTEEQKKIIGDAIQSVADRRKNRLEADEMVKRAKERLRTIEQEQEQIQDTTTVQDNTTGNTSRMEVDDGPETIDLSIDPPESFEETDGVLKRGRSSDRSKDPPSTKSKSSKSVQQSVSLGGNSNTIGQGGSRVSTRARALAGLRASRSGGSQATENNWGSLRK